MGSEARFAKGGGKKTARSGKFQAALSAPPSGLSNSPSNPLLNPLRNATCQNRSDGA
jgi:hypothetical protein